MHSRAIVYRDSSPAGGCGLDPPYPRGGVSLVPLRLVCSGPLELVRPGFGKVALQTEACQPSHCTSLGGLRSDLQVSLSSAMKMKWKKKT